MDDFSERMTFLPLIAAAVWAFVITGKFYAWDPLVWWWSGGAIGFYTLKTQITPIYQETLRLGIFRVLCGAYAVMLGILLLLYARDSALFLASVLAWYFLGRFVMHFFIRARLGGVEESFFALLIGLLLYSLFVLGLGLEGHLYPRNFVIALTVLIVAGCSFFRPRFSTQALWKGFHKAEDLFTASNSASIIAILLFALLFVAAVTNFLPPTGTDDIRCYMAAPARYAFAHRIFFTPDIPLSNTPFCAPMLYLHGLAFGSLIYIGLVNLFFTFLLLGAFYVLGRKFFHPLSGCLAFLFLFSVFYYVRQMSYGNFDIRFVIFCISALYGFLVWQSNKEGAWLRLAGLMAGGMLSFRYQGLIEVAFLELAIVVCSLKERPYSLTYAMINSISFLAPFLLIASPWFLKNFYYMGDPLFPGCFKWHGHYYGYMGDAEFSKGYYDYGNPADPMNFGIYGLGTSWRSFLRLPWNLTFNGICFEGYVFSPIYLALTPLIFLRQKFAAYRWILLFCLFYAIGWFFQIQQLKFFMPVETVFGFAIADALLVPSKQEAERPLLRVLVGLALVVCIIQGIRGDTLALSKDTLPIAFRLRDTKAYMHDNLYKQDLVDFINTRLPANANIFSVWDPLLFYVQRQYSLGSHSFKPVDYRHCATFDNFLARLKELGITHVILPKTLGLSPPLEGPFEAARYILMKHIDRRHLHILYEDDSIFLAEILYPDTLAAYDNRQTYDPKIVGDWLYHAGNLDAARDAYEKAKNLGNKEAAALYQQIATMNHLERGDFYLHKARELRQYIYFPKAALDEYDAVAPGTIDPKVLRERRQAIYDCALHLAPHIWSRIQRALIFR